MFALGALVNVVLYVFARWIAAPLRRLVSHAGSLEKSEVSAAPSEETRYADAARLGAALAGCCRVLAGSRGRIRQEAGAASSRSAS